MNMSSPLVTGISTCYVKVKRSLSPGLRKNVLIRQARYYGSLPDPVRGRSRQRSPRKIKIVAKALYDDDDDDRGRSDSSVKRMLKQFD